MQRLGRANAKLLGWIARSPCYGSSLDASRSLPYKLILKVYWDLWLTDSETRTHITVFVFEINSKFEQGWSVRRPTVSPKSNNPVPPSSPCPGLPRPAPAQRPPTRPDHSATRQRPLDRTLQLGRAQQAQARGRAGEEKGGKGVNFCR